jgi:hypothetical protein
VPGSYYGGADLWGNSFTNDVGDLFEQNVGAAARDDPNTQLYPQILYDEVKRSVDRIIVSDNGPGGSEVSW